MNDVWYGLQDHNRYVYHYTSSSTLADKILPTGKLRFSRFENVNDPRESKEWTLPIRLTQTPIKIAGIAAHESLVAT